jgi:hypothetical protein
MVDSALPPAAQALQLDAKLRAEAEPVEVELAPILPAGWALQIDGRAHARGPVPAGRRVLHLVGPEGQRIGAVLPLEAAAAVHVSTHDGLREAAQAARPDGPVLRWLAVRLTPLLEREARAVLVVNLSAEPPIVRHFDGERFLVLTATSPAGWRADAVLAGGRGVPRGASAALLGGGLAATAVGVIVAALAHRDGVALEEEMQTGIGFSDNHAGFQAAVAQERLGVGLAAGGGVVAGVGAVTFVLPPLRAGRGGGP